jgi:hypothetical protein
MHNNRLQCVFLTLIAVAWGSFVATNVLGQIPSNYGSYYTQNAGTRGVNNSSRYLYDKYFYHNTAVSPYLNDGF